MGMSVKELERRKRLPWPRYRVSIWNARAVCWQDLPTVFYEVAAALSVGGAQAARGHKVRICTMQEDGSKADTPLEAFEKEVRG